MNTVFKALNDATRRKILDLLRESDLTAGDIAEKFDMTKPSISHHLSLLKQAGLVIDIRNGQHIVYSINATVLDEVLQWLFHLSGGEQKESESTEENKNQSS